MSIYSSQADLYNNSFMNPMNPANMNAGWGIDPSLLTPSFTAPYRPQYQGPQPYNQYGKIGFWSGVNMLGNPLLREPYWSNPIDQNRGATESVTNRPSDALAWMGQRVIAPAVAFGAASRLLSPRTFTGYFTGSGVAAGIGQGVGRGIGGSVGWAAGRVFGAGAARAGMSAGAATMGLAGSLVGGVAIPLAVGYAATKGLEEGLWRSYITDRRVSQDLRSNFSGITFGDSTGNVITGGGLGFAESQRIGNNITRSALRDMTFSRGQFENISDMSARAGLLDNVNSQQISKRIKDISEQIKLVVAISKDPDLKTAIEELSKLQMAGASVAGGQFSVASGAYRTMGRLASVAGMSVQRLMNTAGAQGQYLYQANGMTPYLGQIAAANTLAGFASAERIGLMSPAQLARMGGIEGATQASMTGQINASQTMYNKMALYNSYLGGGTGNQVYGPNQNINSVISKFGSSVAVDPLGTIGKTVLYGNQMAGNQMANRGSLATEDQFVSIMRTMPMIRRNANGKYDAQQMVGFMQMAGMSEDTIRAYFAQRAAETDPRVVNQQMRALDRNLAEQQRTYISQNMSYRGFAGRTAAAAVRGIHSLGEAMYDQMVDPVTGRFAALGDTVGSLTDKWMYGSTISKGSRVGSGSDLFTPVGDQSNKINYLNDVSNVGTGGKGIMAFNLFGQLYNRTADRMSLAAGSFKRGFTQGEMNELGQRINQLAKSGDPDAIRFLQSKGADKSKALRALMTARPGEFGRYAGKLNDVDNPQNFEDFVRFAESNRGKEETLGSTKAGSQGEELINALAKTAGGKTSDVVNNLKVTGGAYYVEQGLASGAITADQLGDVLSDPRFASLKAAVGDKTGSAAASAIHNIVGRGSEEGTLSSSVIAFNAGVTTDKSYAKKILDPNLRKKFLAATSDEERQKILLSDVVARNQGRVLDDKISKASGLSRSELAGLTQNVIETAQTREQRYTAMKGGSVDYGNYQSTINSLDNSANMFMNAAQIFSKAVDKDSQKRGGTSGADPLGNAPGMVDRAGAILRQMFGNNQKEIGKPN